MPDYFDGESVELDLSPLDKRLSRSLIDPRGESLRALMLDEDVGTALDDYDWRQRFDYHLAATRIERDLGAFYGEGGQAVRDPQLRALLDITERYQSEFPPPHIPARVAPQTPRLRAQMTVDAEMRGSVNSFFASLFSDEETSGGEFARAKAEERLNELRKLPNADKEALDNLQQNLEVAFSQEGKAQQAAILQARIQYNKDTMSRSGFFAGAAAEVTDITDSSRAMEWGMMAATAPVGFAATMGASFVRFGILGGGITALEELPMARNRLLEADAYELGDEYKSEVRWDAVKNIAVGALLEGAFGTALHAGYLGIGRAAAARGSESFKGAQTAWREWRTPQDVRQARDAHDALATKERRTAPDETDTAVKVRLPKGEKPARTESGFDIMRRLTGDEVGEAEFEVRRFGTSESMTPEDFEAFVKDANIGKTLEAKGVEVVVERGGENRVAFLNPRKAEEPPTPDVEEAAPTNPDGSPTDGMVAFRGNEFIERIPFEKEGVESRPLPLTEDGRIDKSAFSDLGDVFSPKRQSIKLAEDTDAILRFADENTPRMDEIYAVQGNQVVMKRTHPRGFAEEVRLAYATQNPTAPGILRAVLDGNANMARSAFPPPTADLAARQYRDYTDSILENAVRQVAREGMQGRVRENFPDLAGRYDAREIFSQWDKRGKDEARMFFEMRDRIAEAGIEVENTPLARADLDFVFDEAKTMNKRVAMFRDLQEGQRQTTALIANSNEYRRSVLKNLEGLTDVVKREEAAKRTAGIYDDVGEPSSAAATPDGKVEITRLDGTKGFKPFYRIANKGDAFVIQRKNIDQFPKSDSEIVNYVRRGEWGMGKKDKVREARLAEIPKRPFVTFLLTGGQSITDARAWRGAKWRGLALPPKTKFGRMSKTNRGWGDLGIDVEVLRRNFLINNKEGLTEEQMKDFLQDGGALADIIENEFPEVLTGETGVHNYDAVEGGLFGIFRRGLEADFDKKPLMDKADEDFVKGDRAQQHYEEEEYLRRAELGYADTEIREGIIRILADDGISWLNADEAQIEAAYATLRANDAAKLELLAKMNKESGFTVDGFYEANKDAVQGVLRERGYEMADDGIVWTNKANADDWFDIISPSWQLSDAVLAVVRNKDNLSDGVREIMNVLTFHGKRRMLNADRIPPDSFSMLEEVYASLIEPLELRGIELPEDMIPDISTGGLFSKFLRAKGIDTKEMPTYQHRFVNGRKEQPARLYPVQYHADFMAWYWNEWLPNRAPKYFERKGMGAALAEIPNKPYRQRAAEQEPPPPTSDVPEQIGTADTPPEFFDDIPPPTPTQIRQAAAQTEADNWATVGGEVKNELKATREVARAGSVLPDEKPKPKPGEEAAAEPEVPEPTDDSGVVWSENGWQIIDEGDEFSTLKNNSGEIVGRYQTYEEALGRYIRDTPNGVRDANDEARRMIACLKGIRRRG